LGPAAGSVLTCWSVIAAEAPGAVFVLFIASIVFPFSATSTLPAIRVRMASEVSLLTDT
jgi:hypothetical protein